MHHQGSTGTTDDPFSFEHTNSFPANEFPHMEVTSTAKGPGPTVPEEEVEATTTIEKPKPKVITELEPKWYSQIRQHLADNWPQYLIGSVWRLGAYC